MVLSFLRQVPRRVSALMKRFWKQQKAFSNTFKKVTWTLMLLRRACNKRAEEEIFRWINQLQLQVGAAANFAIASCLDLLDET
eukprot:m.353242 g.353242  ORF g.353242 m.353242 type:complete len:83 (-) comp16715_c0_seq1:315-563(-)